MGGPTCQQEPWCCLPPLNQKNCPSSPKRKKSNPLSHNFLVIFEAERIVFLGNKTNFFGLHSPKSNPTTKNNFLFLGGESKISKNIIGVTLIIWSVAFSLAVPLSAVGLVGGSFLGRILGWRQVAVVLALVAIILCVPHSVELTPGKNS